MTKEKVTLTLDADRLATLRRLVGSRSLSASVDEGLAAYVERLEHFAAMDELLEEMEQEYGPIPPADLAWAKQVVDGWQLRTSRSSHEAG